MVKFLLVTVVSLNMAFINQYPAYPSGCESVAAVEVLNYYGYPITEDKFINKYLPTIEATDKRVQSKGNIFDKYFVGSPADVHGCLCNPPVIVKSVNKYLKGKGRKAYDLTGTDFRLLLDEVSNGHPVLIWATVNYVQPTEKMLYNSKYYVPSHTIVITGYNIKKNTVEVIDSISGRLTLKYPDLKEIYEAVDKKSVVIK